LLYEIASVLTVNYDDPCDTVQWTLVSHDGSSTGTRPLSSYTPRISTPLYALGPVIAKWHYMIWRWPTVSVGLCMLGDNGVNRQSRSSQILWHPTP
jgi:hypothetical protein